MKKLLVLLSLMVIPAVLFAAVYNNFVDYSGEYRGYAVDLTNNTSVMTDAYCYGATGSLENSDHKFTAYSFYGSTSACSSYSITVGTASVGADGYGGVNDSTDTASGFVANINNDPYAELSASLCNLTTDYITPIITWTYADGDSHPQKKYEVQLSKNDFASNHVDFRSGEIAATAPSWNVLNSSMEIPEGIYKLRIRVMDDPWQQWTSTASAWDNVSVAISTYSITFDTTPPQNVQITTLIPHISSITVRMEGTDTLSQWFQIMYSTSTAFEPSISTTTAWMTDSTVATGFASTSTQVTLLIPDTTYYFKVRAKDWFYGRSDGRDSLHFTDWNTIPYAQTTFNNGLNVYWGAITNTTIQVNFPELAGPDNPLNTVYKVQLSTSQNFESNTLKSSDVVRGIGTSAIVSGLTPNTTYFGQVVTEKTYYDYQLNRSSSVTFFYFADPVSTSTRVSPPFDPQWETGFTANTLVKVTWGASIPDDNPADTRYIVEVSTSDVDFYPIECSSETVRGIGYGVVSDLTPNTTYYSRVRAVNRNNVSSSTYVTANEVTLTSVPNPSWPATVDITTGTMKINWGVSSVPKDNPDATVYTIQISTISQSFTAGNIYSSQTIKSAGTAIIGNLPVNTTCYARVIATNWSLESTTYYLVIGSATRANVPDPITVSTKSWDITNFYNLDLRLHTNGNPQVAGYETEYMIVRYQNGLTDGTTIQDWTRHSDFELVTSSYLIPNKTYTYRIKARNHDRLVTEYSMSIPTTTAPSQISSLWTTNISSSNIFWQWSSNVNEANCYNVYTSTNGLLKTNNGSGSVIWVQTDLQPNTSHQIYVKAQNDYGEGKWSTGTITNDDNIQITGATYNYDRSVSTYTLAAMPGQSYITDVTSGSIRVTINNAPNNSSITEYAIKCVHLGNGSTYYVDPFAPLMDQTTHWYTYDQFGGSQGINVNGFLGSVSGTLDASTWYNFYVIARNKYNHETAYSLAASTQTKAQNPDIVITQVSTNTISFFIRLYQNPTNSKFRVRVNNLEDGTTHFVKPYEGSNRIGYLDTQGDDSNFVLQRSTTEWGGYLSSGTSLSNGSGEGSPFTVFVSTPANSWFKFSVKAMDVSSNTYSDYTSNTISTYTKAVAPIISWTAVESSSITIKIDNAYLNTDHTRYAIKNIDEDGTTYYVKVQTYDGLNLDQNGVWGTPKQPQSQSQWGVTSLSDCRIPVVSLVPNMGYRLSVIAENDSTDPVPTQYSNVYSTWTKLVTPSKPMLGAGYGGAIIGNYVEVSTITPDNSHYTRYGIMITAPGNSSRLLSHVINETVEGTGGNGGQNEAYYLKKSLWEANARDYSTVKQSAYIKLNSFSASASYDFWLIAYSDNRKEYSGPSLKASIKTPPDAPNPPSVLQIENKYLKIGLAASVLGAERINIYRSNSSDGTNLVFTGQTYLTVLQSEQGYIYDVDGSTPVQVAAGSSLIIPSTSTLLIQWNGVDRPAPSDAMWYCLSGVSKAEDGGAEGKKSDMFGGADRLGVRVEPIITRYKLYFDGGGVAIVNAGIAQSSFSYVMSNLTPNTSYSYRISAISSDGLEGSKSDSFSSYTLAAVVGNLQCVSGWDVSQNINYNNVISFTGNGNPAYTNYAVSVLVEGATYWLQGNGTTGTNPFWYNQLSWNHWKLEPLREYKYSVYAKNENGTITDCVSISATVPLVSKITMQDLVCYYGEGDTRQITSGAQSKAITPKFVWGVTTTSFPVVGYSYSWDSDALVNPPPGNTINLPATGMSCQAVVDSVLVNFTSASWTVSPAIDPANGNKMYYFKVKAIDSQGQVSETKQFSFPFFNKTKQPHLVGASISPRGGVKYNSVYYGVPANATIVVPFEDEMSSDTITSDNIYLQAVYNHREESVNEKVFPTFEYSTATKVLNINAALKSNWVYDVVITTNVKDSVWNPLDQESRVRFRVLISKNNSSEIIVGTDKGSIRQGRVLIPQNALTDDLYIVMNDNPLQSPTRVASVDLKTANNKLGTKNSPVWYVEANMYDSNNIIKEGYTFSTPVTLEMGYTSTDGKVVDGTTIRVETLSVWWLDETKKMWVKVPSTVDKVNRKILASISHFSAYAIVGSINLAVDDVVAAPVPWVPDGPNASQGGAGIQFSNMPQEGEILIYTINGELVKKIIVTGYNGFVSGSGNIVWDGKNDRGQDVASGVYIWVVKTSESKKTGKLIVVR